MRRQTIVLICLSLSVTAWGASPDTRKHSAWQPVGSAPPAIQAAVAADPRRAVTL